MGGNARHASKGPDRSESTCDDCGHTWTHGKFSSYTYCESCREKRRDEDEVRTEIDVGVRMEEGEIGITVNLIKDFEVPLKVEIPKPSDAEDYLCVVGYIRLEAGDASAENAWIRGGEYSGMKLSRSVEFIWTPDGIEQQDKPTVSKSRRPLGETNECDDHEGPRFRDRIKSYSGDPLDADEIEATFVPATDGTWLDEETETEDIPSYKISLDE